MLGWKRRFTAKHVEPDEWERYLGTESEADKQPDRRQEQSQNRREQLKIELVTLRIQIVCRRP